MEIIEQKCKTYFHTITGKHSPDFPLLCEISKCNEPVPCEDARYTLRGACTRKRRELLQDEHLQL